jgi:hypothetical protein
LKKKGIQYSVESALILVTESKPIYIGQRI